MFKKDADVIQSSQTLLKNKEVKKLKKDVSEQFSRLKQEEIDEFFSSSNQIILIKLESRTLIYYIQNVPYIVDEEGRNKLFPTVYFLWKYPNCLRQMRIPGPVSEFILRGADLFSPGLATYEGLETLLRYEKVSIVVTGNPMPFAVGYSNVSYEAILVNRGQGKAVNVIHYFGDKLCKTNVRPNIGFSLRVIIPIEDLIGNNSNDSSSNSDNNNNNNNSDEIIIDSESSTTIIMSDSAIINSMDNSLETKGHVISENIKEMMEEEEEQEERYYTQPMGMKSQNFRTIDDTVIRGLLLAIRYLIKDDQLPILASNVWKQVQKAIICDPHYKPFVQSSSDVPSSVRLINNDDDHGDSNSKSNLSDTRSIPDIRKSRFKQVSSLLNHASKDLNLLETENNNGIISVTSINRHNSLFKQVTLQDSLDEFKSAITLHASSIANDKVKESSELSNHLAGLSVDRILSIKALTNETFFPSIHASGSQGHGEKNKFKIKALDLYKFSRQLNDLFIFEINNSSATVIEYQKQRSLLSDGIASSKSLMEVYSYAEVKNIIYQYIENNQLENVMDKKCVILPPSCPLHSVIESSVAKTSNLKSKHSSSILTTSTTIEVEDKLNLSDDGGDNEEDNNNNNNNDNNDDDNHNHNGYDSDEMASSFPALSLSTSKSVIGGVSTAPILSQAAWTGSNIKLNSSTNPMEKAAWKPILLPSSSTDRKNISVSSSNKTEPLSNKEAWPLPSTSSSSTKGVIKPVENKESIILRKDKLLSEVMKKMSVYHAIVSNQGDFKIAYGRPPTIQLTTQKRAGNKLVTSIRGLEAFNIDMDGMVKEFKKKFACSVTVAPIKGIEKESEVLIQGNADVREMLTKNYGIPIDCIVTK